MIAVDGEAARELGRIARERWRCSTKKEIPAARAKHDPWPVELKPDLEDIDVAISCTAPECEPHAEAREIEALYLDIIARARHYIYIENQYFTAYKIGEALAARLAAPRGPEVVVVTRLLSQGWLEEYTMGVLRTKLIERLREADSENRFHVYYPHMPGLTDGTCIDVHSKMMAVDDQWLRIGSANLANRSMGLDTECDIAIEALGNADIARVIRQFRDRLLAEHLGLEAETVAREIKAQGSIHGAIEALRIEGRTLKPLTNLENYSDAVISMAEMTDPERAVGLDQLMAQFSFGAEFHKPPRALQKLGVAVAVAVGATAIARFTPLRRLLTIRKSETVLERFLKKLRR
jgi:phosphatidylserine/phosphatidylglycerophosphate/cardiolipin synthase-like enzyme